MKMGVVLLFGRTKRPDLHRTSSPAFFAAFRWQLGARCSLDRCDNSRVAGVGEKDYFFEIRLINDAAFRIYGTLQIIRP
jgi:hypothetical protein